MASGGPAQTGKAGGVFASGLPAIGAALARMTAGHFTSAAHKNKAAAAAANVASQNTSIANNNNNHHVKQATHFDARLQKVAPRAPQAAQRASTQQQHQQQASLFHQPQMAPNGRQQQAAATAGQNYEQAHCQEDEQSFYADQLRRGQLHQRLQQQGSPAASASSSVTSQPQHPSESAQRHHQHHVNFGLRTSSHTKNHEQPNDGGADELGAESTRKKKYLTAKYGAQQMSLIKKRLKIEMWLHERLQELTSASKLLTADQLDELDIDLDQLLDLEDERARKKHLSELLAPLADVPRDSLEQFIHDVLEQSKLL